MEILNQPVELIELKNWWLSNSNVWFDSTESDDINIAVKYEDLVKSNFDEEIIIQNKEFGIGYIILHDQITRHIARVQCYPNNYIFNNLNKILGFVKKFYSKYCDDLEGYEFCFVLLPLRHSNDFEEQTFVMRETWKKIDTLSNPISDTLIKVYKNYLKATYERASNGQVYLDEYKSNDTNLREILDPRCIEHLGPPLNKKNSITNKLEKNCECLKTNKNKKYILSISGGVDSMVLARILFELDIDFVLVHINYANRGVMCEKEKQLLSNWANIYQVELYIRDIYEINRPKCMEYDMRNLYEDYTRNVRYNTYCDVAKLKGWVNEDWCVLLGHNHDDCVENILTNIANKTKYDNLKGMEYETKIKFNSNNLSNMIIFIRPLLTISKEEIYQYADNQKIAYLLDSTPQWSQRGKIRDIVRPGLIEWNHSSLEGLEEIACVMKESLECVELLVSNWIEKIQPLDTLGVKEQVKIIGVKMSMSKPKINVIKLSIGEILVNKIFWSKILEKINFKSNLKSINMLVDKINTIKTKFNTIQIKQLSQIQINVNNRIYWWKINDTQIIFGFE
jgi:tRNA(Ile)-lysidine synthetase-like protein